MAIELGISAQFQYVDNKRLYTSFVSVALAPPCVIILF